MLEKNDVLKFLCIIILLVTVSGSTHFAHAAPEQQDDEPVLISREYIEINPYATVETLSFSNGTSIEGIGINGPSDFPETYAQEIENTVKPLPERGVISKFPSYSWVFGSSAVSAAMIAAYYDRNGYPNMYAGPKNNGIIPLTDAYWTKWFDGYKVYPNNPFVASHKGVDGRTTRGTIDDYWVRELSTAQDPYITGGWLEHIWSSAVGDYMKTSQSEYDNIDGKTQFYTWASSPVKYTCADMETYNVHNLDGTYGRKLFYEERGYTVTECYNQKTDNNSGGFTLEKFKAEIDAGHPVFLNLEGHSVVGYGYSGSTIYIRDTWSSDLDFKPTMTWGGSYAGMELESVSIVKAKKPVIQPEPINPTSATPTHKPTYKWTAVPDATNYIFQVYKGSTKVFGRLISSLRCGTNYCAYTPDVFLQDESYQWRVQAKVGGIWREFSSFKWFNVATDFHYTFNDLSDLELWNTVYGPWNLKNSWYRSSGDKFKVNSVVHDGLYPTFTYIVRMRRINDANTANRLYVRGTPYPLGENKSWKNGYYFQYTNNGYFSVWKAVNGTLTKIAGWTFTPAINQFGWNTMKVTGQGHILKFYINDQIVWGGLDSSLPIGKVGIGFVKDGDPAWQPFLVEGAHLFTYKTISSLETEEWAEIGETNAEWNDPDMSPPAP